jgi:hypothetical protein
MDHSQDMPAHVFGNTVQHGVLTAEELARSLGPLTASAQAVGVSFEELGALIVGITRCGGDPAYTLDGLRQLLDCPPAWQATRSLLTERFAVDHVRAINRDGPN